MEDRKGTFKVLWGKPGNFEELGVYGDITKMDFK
jgi:hypothetical protein